MFEEYKIEPGQKIKLSSISPDYTGDKNKKELKKLAKENIKQIIHWQEKLYAESRQAFLIILQALDAGGKDGTIRKVFGRINPQGCRVTSFKGPTGLELAHDFLWRIHQAVPKKGMIGIFNRSHYEDILVVKVHDWINDEECSKRIRSINDFEHHLTDQGTKIIKFFLYISKDEQKNRFQDRLDRKDKNWKFSHKDIEERKLWDKYIKQFEEVFEHTSTDYAPWYVIPANNKRYRDLVISTIVKELMVKMNPQFPPPEEDLGKVKID